MSDLEEDLFDIYTVKEGDNFFIDYQLAFDCGERNYYLICNHNCPIASVHFRVPIKFDIEIVDQIVLGLNSLPVGMEVRYEKEDLVLVR